MSYDYLVLSICNGWELYLVSAAIDSKNIMNAPYTCSFYMTTLFCQVGVLPFISALAVGLLILVAAIVLPLFVDKV